MKLQPNNEPRSSLGIEPSSDDEVGSRQEFARRFTEGIGKLAGNTKRDCWEKDRRTYHKNAGGYRIMQEKVEGTTFPENPVGKPPVSDGWTAHTT
ncbi:hypothetical protein GW17_00004861 [Ensete ventricosum]|nr:hypothetical protein GW17_00004861 [Ensete ventricosum]